MKVVLFCGGKGTRIDGSGEGLPKPMLSIGYRPILWHVMKYYAHFGHTDFILCLGYKASAIKHYFLHYNEAESNDFVMSQGGRSVQLMSSDIDDWTITFVDTGPTTNIGQRLKAVESHLAGEEHFLANYSDGLTDLDLPGICPRSAVQGKGRKPALGPAGTDTSRCLDGRRGMCSGYHAGDRDRPVDQWGLLRLQTRNFRLSQRG